MLARIKRLERRIKPRTAAELLPDEYHRRGLLTLAEALTDIIGQPITSDRLTETLQEALYVGKIKTA